MYAEVSWLLNRQVTGSTVVDRGACFPGDLRRWCVTKFIQAMSFWRALRVTEHVHKNAKVFKQSVTPCRLIWMPTRSMYAAVCLCSSVDMPAAITVAEYLLGNQAKRKWHTALGYKTEMVHGPLLQLLTVLKSEDSYPCLPGSLVQNSVCIAPTVVPGDILC